ncbi:g11820 [Coccomyxa elongata]
MTGNTVMLRQAREAGSVTDGVHPNELPTGTAPEDPVQLPDFTVFDSTGSDFSLDKLQGDFTLLVFGATRDYEDAKSRVQNLSEVIRQTDRRSNMQYMRALFVIEEPSEEAQEKMGDLLGKHQKKTERRSHGPRMIGLAGSEVAKIREMVNVFNDRVAEEGKTEVVQKGDPDGTLFLINPDGQLVAGFKYAAHGADTKEVAEAIATEMKQWTHSHPTWHAPKAVKSRHA